MKFLFMILVLIGLLITFPVSYNLIGDLINAFLVNITGVTFIFDIIELFWLTALNYAYVAMFIGLCTLIIYIRLWGKKNA